jgi:hypothetical protein
MLHHVIVPHHVMDCAGVDFRGQLLTSTPAAFLLGFFLSRPMPWLMVNMLVYRLKFRNFIIVQPLVLLASIPGERHVCKWAAYHHPGLAATAFNSMALWIRALLSSPQALSALGDAPANDALAACCKVHAFMTLVAALVIPGLVIWQLEQQMWRDFVQRPPASLAWPGGPSIEELTAAQAAQRSAQGRPLLFNGRLVAVGFVLAATAWLFLDAMV